MVTWPALTLVGLQLNAQQSVKEVSCSSLQTNHGWSVQVKESSSMPEAMFLPHLHLVTDSEAESDPVLTTYKLTP